MRRTPHWIPSFYISSCVLLTPFALPAADVNPEQYLAHIQYLASPELKGRATGSPELETAAAYIAKQFQSFGLKPVDGKSSADLANYELAFPAELGASLGPGNAFSYRDPGSRQTLK